jgi:hypothetical protein
MKNANLYYQRNLVISVNTKGIFYFSAKERGGGGHNAAHKDCIKMT